MDVEHLKAGPVGVEGSHVYGIAVAESHAIEQFSVVINGSRTPDDFIASVAVNVADGQVVVAVAIEGVAAFVGRTAVVGPRGFGPVGVVVLHLRLAGGGMEPAVNQLSAVEIDGPHKSLGVVAAAEHCRGLHAVEIGHGSQEAVATSAVAVAPTAGIGRRHILGVDAEGAVGIIPSGVDGMAVGTAEHGEKFGAFEHISVAVAIALRVLRLAFNGVVGGGG